MKVLIVLYYYQPYVSGLSLLAKMEAEGLAARGHQVTVLALRHQNDLLECETINGVQVVRAKVLAKIGKGGLSWDFLREVVALAKQHDIVNPHLPMAHFGLILPLIDTKKLVPQYHCDLNLGSGIVSRMVERFSYWSMKKTLANSKRIIVTTLDYFSNCHFSQFAHSACQIYPPIDQSRFGPRDPSPLKKRLGLTGNHYLIGFVGRIVAEKGLDYLIKAIPMLRENHRSFLILIAGDYENIAGGSIKSKLDKLLDDYADSVMFTGYLQFDDLVQFYNLVDVLVLPSVDPLEAFGMVQVEAMLCGTPVIATDMPGVREVVKETGFGKLVKKKDPQDIADKVDELMRQSVTLRTGALELFSFERSIDEYENVFVPITER